MSSAPGGDDPFVFGDACAAAAILAVDPIGLGGVRLTARCGPTRHAWQAQTKALAAGRSFAQLPSHLDDTVLFGGLDISATLSAGRTVRHRGFLEQANGAIIVMPGAERCSAEHAARIAHVMDSETSGEASPTRFSVIALDERVAPDEGLPGVLAERLAIHLYLDEWSREWQNTSWPFTPATIDDARARLADIHAPEAIVEAICETARALGIATLRAPLAALHVARCAAALDQRPTLADEDLALATRLVLAPRATRRPARTDDSQDRSVEADDSSAEADPTGASEAETSSDTEPADNGEAPGASETHKPREASADDSSDATDHTSQSVSQDIEDLMLEAATARLPAGLLEGTGELSQALPRAATGGRRGPKRADGARGRPLASRPGLPNDRQRLDVMATLRAAAPWQRLRGRPHGDTPLRIRKADLHVRRFASIQETATLFVVDASGSSALHRLAEAKGAVELLLADCYIRRDRVGLIVFRGRAADAVLPPTRSLTRAKRVLAGLPGGGPTPLAGAIDEAGQMADQAAAAGQRPLLVFLTDGRGNIDATGVPNRARAAADSERAAARLAARGYRALVIDIAPRPRPAAKTLAEQLHARYLGLPQAGAQRLSEAVREVQS
ncbi:magnesium chelatase subunit D [uncultured Salinisphaera sp.]|uniref:magnesium chelatase subunit D n=1 Tax=uncultured Salinisphaera sp. TaxID=359372 RepID=UPI0032B21597